MRRGPPAALLRSLAPLGVLLLLTLAAQASAQGKVPIGAPASAWSAAQLHPLRVAPSTQVAFVIDTFQHDTPFVKQSVAGSAEPDLSEVLLGTRSWRATTDGDGAQVNIRAEGLRPLDLSDVFLRLHLKVDTLAALQHIYLYLSDDGFETHDTYVLLRGNAPGDEHYADDGEWFTVTTVLGTPLAGESVVDLRQVNGIQLSLVDDGTAPVSLWLAGLEAVQRPERGVVTVMFDDARSGVFELGVPLAQRFGVRGSVAVIADLVGDPGFMTLEELTLLERFAGWEMVAHHVTPLEDGGFDVLEPHQLMAELQGIKAWMLEHGFVRGADVIAYPYGGFDTTTLGEVRRYFGAGRTIVRSLGHETYPPADPFRIRALSITDRDTPDRLRAAIDRAARERSWLILVFHQVTSTEPENEAQYRANDFALVMSHLSKADVDVLTFSEAALGR